ncbi:hypothetical protein Tco_0562573 [Tanacetum coccineum]
MLGILKKKMNLIKTAFEAQYGNSIIPKLICFNDIQIIREESKRARTSLSWMSCIDFKGKKSKIKEEAEALRKNPRTRNLRLGLTEQELLIKPVSTLVILIRTISVSDTTNSQEDDTEIPPLEDIHEDTTDGSFTHSSYG